MLVARCVSARVCVCVCWMVPAGRAAHCVGAGEPAPRGGLAQTVSLAPGAARRPLGGLGIGADDLPTTNWRRTRLDITLLAMCGATYCLITVDRREGSSYYYLVMFFLSFNLCTRRMFLDA
jgi:hypothetical protein